MPEPALDARAFYDSLVSLLSAFDYSFSITASELAVSSR